MIENHTFINAFFTDNDRTVIESLWSNNDTGKIVPYHIVAEENEPAYQKLLEYIDIDSLHESTFKEIRRKKEARDSMLLEIAKQEGFSVENIKKRQIGEMLNAWIRTGSDPELSDEQNKEHLFLLKLALFEWEKLVDVNDKELKKNLRKSSDSIEALYYVLDYLHHHR